MDFPILSAMLAVPLVAAVACLFLGAPAARMVALVATLIDLVTIIVFRDEAVDLLRRFR